MAAIPLSKPIQGWVKTMSESWQHHVAMLLAGPSAWSAWVWICLIIGCMLAFWFMLFAVAMYLQELKSYAGRVSFPKMMLFALTWMNCSFWASMTCIPSLLLGRTEKAAERAHYWGSIMGQFMFRILAPPPIVEGLDNLPPDGDKGMVYVSNHQSSVDIAAFYYIGTNRKFSWVSKSTVFLIPGVGLLMKIAHYVALKRGNRDSVRKMFDDCKKRLAAGWSVMIFPQGTRRRLKMLDFKDGAFQLAIDSGSTVVPFSIFLPEDLFFGPRERCRIVVHKAIRPGDEEFKDVATLRQYCFDKVTDSLPYAKEMIERQAREKRTSGGAEGKDDPKAAPEAKKTK